MKKESKDVMNSDEGYFGWMDASGKRSFLSKDQLIVFIMDRLGYCKYRAKQIVYEYHKNHNEIDWKLFVNLLGTTVVLSELGIVPNRL